MHERQRVDQQHQLHAHRRHLLGLHLGRRHRWCDWPERVLHNCFPNTAYYHTCTASVPEGTHISLTGYVDNVDPSYGWGGDYYNTDYQYNIDVAMFGDRGVYWYDY